ncbi:hypothetical protein CDEST_07493 [Colletotrichum destructivum]|uniref:Uncharacterized protein n=1 Tax=Colletotrichum destructivum TaxID=34406 RepID=A0AAX4IHZ9_9PEZI|nr:hypothetical protein CDEST_07493 [Colletotrichum destructivum]
MEVTLEAIIAIVSLVVGLPPALLMLWRCCQSRRRSRTAGEPQASGISVAVLEADYPIAYRSVIPNRSTSFETMPQEENMMWSQQRLEIEDQGFDQGLSFDNGGVDVVNCFVVVVNELLRRGSDVHTWQRQRSEADTPETMAIYRINGVVGRLQVACEEANLGCSRPAIGIPSQSADRNPPPPPQAEGRSGAPVNTSAFKQRKDQPQRQASQPASPSRPTAQPPQIMSPFCALYYRATPPW